MSQGAFGQYGGNAEFVAAMLAGMFTLTHFMHLRWPPNLIGW